MAARLYEIYVRGPVPPGALPELQGVTVREVPLTTLLTGEIADQAALHGVLLRLQDLGLELVELRRLETRPDGA
jgi:hypothetical protein